MPNALHGVHRQASNPLAPDAAVIDRFLGYCHRRRYPPRTEVFRPGDPAGTLYYMVTGSTSIITEEDDGRELVLGYFGTGEFVGEMGLFVSANVRQVLLRSRTTGNAFDMNLPLQVADLLEHSREQAAQHDVQLLAASGLLYAASGQQQAAREMTWVGGGATVGILLLLLLAFRRWRVLLAFVPVLFIGVGEKMDDLLDFDPNAFVEALLG